MIFFFLKKGNNVSHDYESCFLYVWRLGHIEDYVAPGKNSSGEINVRN